MEKTQYVLIEITNPETVQYFKEERELDFRWKNLPVTAGGLIIHLDEGRGVENFLKKIQEAIKKPYEEVKI